MSELILAIDPGKTVGYSIWQTDKGLIDVGEKSFEEFIASLWVMNEMGAVPDIIVIERYTIGQRTIKLTRQYEALYLIGAMISFSLKWDCEFVLQDPAVAKKMWQDDRLKEVGWWQPGLVHARDSLRHLGTFLIGSDRVSISGIRNKMDEGSK